MPNPESFYAPRRKIIFESLTVTGGVAGALWRGATTWVLLLRGIRHHAAAGGLYELEKSVAFGAIGGAIVGAILGWIAGAWWERRHRRRRARVR